MKRTTVLLFCITVLWGCEDDETNDAQAQEQTSTDETASGSQPSDTDVSKDSVSKDQTDSGGSDNEEDAPLVSTEEVDSSVDVDERSSEDETEPETPALPQWSSDKYIGIDEVYQRFTAGDSSMLLMNVVDEEFYNLGHIDGSLVIPWDLLLDDLDRVDGSKNIVIYCRKGVRSESAYTTLADAGFEHVWVMEGGIEQWTAAGYPVVTEIPQ